MIKDLDEKITPQADDIAKKETITLKQASDILGLKYHTARKILHNELSIGSINYGCKTVWIKEDILNYKRRCYIAPKDTSNSEKIQV
ncbi:MAG: hypothetical protein VZR09_00805 [Candidatus Gastranaerophilaceae bacterium]|nr:hypothetical protein [Candidatus Gastranaerophilaceae bacterium]